MITALHVVDLSIARGERRLFAGLSFALAAGEAAQLTGANGAGKTSLLRAVAGLLRPDAGEVRFEGP
ncbi:ATP-binding cassette domain-containing protein, partial [Klebsiella pneumoniae]|uniref:ABC transporter ATP-binding protein n=1 Tax=Klebsiella pneumoniae TaxID=573 RepID=UPI0021C4B4DF